MSKVFKLTPEVLERMINEEKRKLLVQGDGEAKEVDAKDMAKTLANQVDYVKKLKIKEAALKRQTAQVYLKRQALLSKIKENL